MSVAKRYQQASFNRVPFLIRSESETSGKKVVIHEYPNSNKRFVEELGLLPSSFSMAAFLSGPTAYEDSIKLIKALTTPGLGVLIHPVYGRMDDVKCTTFERSTAETEFGDIQFGIKFERSKANVSLTPSITTTAGITNSADLARSSGFNALKVAMIISKARAALVTTQRIATAAMDVASGRVKSINDLDAGAISAFDRVFGTSLRNIYQAASEAELFANTLESFYTSMRSTGSPDQLTYAWQGLITYEGTRIRGPMTTAIRIAQETNTDAINSHTRVNALINLYESLGYTSFSTDQELSDAKALLDSTFETLFSGEEDPITNDQDLRAAVLDLRNQVNAVLDESSKNVFKIKDIQPGESSLPLAAYRFYGNLDNLDTLLDLNPSANWMEVTAIETLKAVE